VVPGIKYLRNDKLTNNLDPKNRKQISDNDFFQKRKGLVITENENKREIQHFQFIFCL
jgi:hypothetical protein